MDCITFVLRVHGVVVINAPMFFFYFFVFNVIAATGALLNCSFITKNGGCNAQWACFKISRKLENYKNIFFFPK